MSNTWVMRIDHCGFFTGQVYEKHAVLDAPAIHKEPVALVEDLSNARLIAAAPELLEALNEILDVIANDTRVYNIIGRDRYQKACAAIDKATS